MDKKKSMPHKTTNHSAFKPNRQRWQDPAPAAVLRTGLNANYRWRSDEEGSRTEAWWGRCGSMGWLFGGWLSYAVFLFWCQAGEKCSHGEPGGEHDWLIKNRWSLSILAADGPLQCLEVTGTVRGHMASCSGLTGTVVCVCVCVTRTAHITV